MRSMWTVVLALILLTWSHSPLGACGDKFLLVGIGRGAKFDRYASLYPGSIVILARDRARAMERTAFLRKALASAGHRVSLITSDELAATLQRGRTDIVIADRFDGPLIDPQLTVLSFKPTMLYVLTDRDQKRAVGVKTVYQLKKDDSLSRWFQVIDEAMQSRAQSGTRVTG